MTNYRNLTPIFRALADPTRRHIVEILCDGDASVSYLLEPLPISLVTLLQHLRTLEKSGLIRTHKIGRTRTCWAEPDGLQVLEQWVRWQIGRCERSAARGKSGAT